MAHIGIIGGGITGVTTAYALARRGYSVTLFERQRYTAMETSFANGGQLSASNAEVWTHPATLLNTNCCHIPTAACCILATGNPFGWLQAAA